MSGIQIKGVEERAGNIILENAKYIQEKSNCLLNDSEKDI